METGFPVGTGTKVEVEIPLPCLPEPVRFKGVVKQVRREGPSLEAGLVFERLPDETRHRITEWVHAVETVVKGPTPPAPAEAPAPLPPKTAPGDQEIPT